MADAPRVVRATERRSATGLPTGVVGEQAFHDAGTWVGFLSLAPGASSPWHHHAGWDSYAYVTRGVLRWEFGDGDRSVEIGAGDVGHMPAWVVHRDVSAGSDELAMILFRAGGEGPLTIDVDGPHAPAEERSA